METHRKKYGRQHACIFLSSMYVFFHTNTIKELISILCTVHIPPNMEIKHTFVAPVYFERVTLPRAQRIDIP